MRGGLFFSPSSISIGHHLTVVENPATIGRMYIPYFNPRLPDVVLGLMIGLGIALAWHWVVWVVH